MLKHFSPKSITSNGELTYDDVLGIGYLDIVVPPDVVYNASYLDKYRAMESTYIGLSLTMFRCNLVRFVANHNRSRTVCDVGVGSGAFVRGLTDMHTSGYDINPHAVDMLVSDGLYGDPYSEQYDYLTFWDSLEHIGYDDIAKLLGNVKVGVFVSCPIYTGFDDIVASKHYRPDEHCWYWTHDGIVTFMQHFGFECQYSCDTETTLGRESIATYYFAKI